MSGLRRRLPPLTALVTFEAAARLRSFTRAAAELGVTQAAVSRQIHLLEDTLGFPVFRRLHRRIELTEKGQTLANAASTALTLVADAIAEAENTQVGQDELTERIIFQAQRYGMPPEQFIQQVQQANQLGAVFADVKRGKALASVVERVTVTDTNGASVDTAELFGSPADAPDEVEAADSSEGEQEK